MGGKSKSESASGSAQAWAKPIAQNAANQATDVYNQAAPGLNQITGQVQGMLGGLGGQYGRTSNSALGLSNAFQGLLPGLANAAGGTYDQAQGLSGQVGNFASGAIGNLGGPNTATMALPAALRSMFGANQGLGAATGYTNDVLSGKYLNSNPALQSVIDATKSGVSDSVNSQFSLAGRYGSGAHTGELAKSLANAEGGLRYSDYNNRLGQMDQAAGMAGNLSQIGMANQSQGINNLLNVANTQSGIGNTQYQQAMGAAQLAPQLNQASYAGLSPFAQIAGMVPQFNSASYAGLPEFLTTATAGAQLPYTGMQAYGNTLGTLFNGGTQTQTTSPGIGGLLGGLGGLASGFGSMGSAGMFGKIGG